MKIKTKIALAVLSVCSMFAMVSCSQATPTNDNIIDKATNHLAEEANNSAQQEDGGDSASGPDATKAKQPTASNKVENSVTKALTPKENSFVLASTDGSLALSNVMTFDETVDFYKTAIADLGVTEEKIVTSQDEATQVDVVDNFRATVGSVADFWQYTGTYQDQPFSVTIMGVSGEDSQRSFAFVSYKPQGETAVEESQSE